MHAIQRDPTAAEIDAAHRNELTGAAHRARRAYAEQFPEQARGLRQALDVAQGARQEAQQAAAALDAHKKTPPTSRDGLAAWKTRAIELTAEAEGLELLATQAERRAADMRRIYDQGIARFVEGRLADARARAVAAFNAHNRRIDELQAQVTAAREQAKREFDALLASEVYPWEQGAIALEVPHELGMYWRNRLAQGKL